ncbi:ATP-grasp domain-containing protein [Bacillus sp. WMMC1349]|uniref:ATP-grasp domain-containing protein n=1 Tax=Bacillus sp. WMMC1349 TaxID=2736254 RepID=UPI001553DA24|nr:ATP-grasp domain-containing protein [Bacillus sp. WMMC1349]NPC94205.1 ATP-grasp domain-containing protein [Bacillus sp. WMMC1349]
MSILVLNSYDQHLNLEEIVPEKLSEMVVLTTPKLNNNHKFQYYEEIESISENECAESRIRELTKYYQFDSLIAHDEYDMVRAGRMRDRFGIPGQTEQSSLSFRHKTIMKEHARQSVRTPLFQEVQSIFDVYEFADEHGYPLIVKPVDQGASRDIFVIRNENDIKEFSRQKLKYSYEVETFIDGEMYHIDGLYVDGKEVLISISKYWNGCMAFKTNASLGSYQLSQKSGEFQEVYSFFQKLLTSFDCPEHVVYHGEVFREHDSGELVFCEIASRYGGGYILQAVEATYGINLKTEWLRSQCGLNMRGELKAETLLHGFLLIPPYQGKLLDRPEKVPFDWVKIYDKSELGADFTNPRRSIDKAAGFMIEGDNEQVLQYRLNKLDAWMRSQFKWSAGSSEHH